MSKQSLSLAYIVGIGHSGSTLLELLLNRNVDIAAMGEINLFNLQLFRNENTRWVGKCSCGKRPFDCPVWSNVIRTFETRHGVDLKLDPFRRSVGDVGLEKEYGRKAVFDWLTNRWHRAVRTLAYNSSPAILKPFDLYYRLMIQRRDEIIRSYAEQQDAGIVVDASKDPLRICDLQQYSEIPTKILFLTRDVRGFAWSGIKKRREDARSAAAKWAHVNGKCLNMLKNVNGDSWRHVKYEDLCSNHEGELDRIFQFLGVENRTIDPADEYRKRHTIAGNRIRFRRLDHVVPDNDWKRRLSAREIEQIADVAGTFADRLGYDL
ncbi:sulfotransferase [Pseudomonadota bacterium]